MQGIPSIEEKLEIEKMLKARFGELYDGFLEEFPEEALKAVPGPGMTLTSVSPQYIVERLNKVCGLEGWTHKGAYEFKMIGSDEVVIYYGKLVLPNGVEREAAGAAVIRNAKDLSNAIKSAKTDSLSKCASYLGIANEVFKGNVEPPQAKRKPRAVSSGSGRRDF